MKSYIEKMKKISGSGQCALALAIAEKIMAYEELKIEIQPYNLAKDAIDVYWKCLNGEIDLDYNDIYLATIGIGDEEDCSEKGFFLPCQDVIDKYGDNNNISIKYLLILDIFLILALHTQGKEIEYYGLDTDVCDIGDEFVEEFIQKVLEQKIMSEDELYLLLDYLNQKYPAYCDINRKSLLSAIKSRNRILTKKGYKRRIKRFIRKGYKIRNYRRINASGQCALVLVIAEKALNSEKLDKTDSRYQFAQERIAYCWKWLNGEIKGKENVQKVIHIDDENELICCFDQEDEINQLYAIACRAIWVVEDKALLSYDEFNNIENTLFDIMHDSIKLNVMTQKEYNSLVDYLDNQYYNYPNISKSEMMALLEKNGK